MCSLRANFTEIVIVYCEPSLVHENLSHRISRRRHGMSAEFLFFASHFTNVIRTAKFLQVFLASDNSLCHLFHCSAVNQSNDILCEYNVRTAGQLASRICDVFIAVE